MDDSSIPVTNIMRDIPIFYGKDLHLFCGWADKAKAFCHCAARYFQTHKRAAETVITREHSIFSKYGCRLQRSGRHGCLEAFKSLFDSSSRDIYSSISVCPQAPRKSGGDGQREGSMDGAGGRELHLRKRDASRLLRATRQLQDGEGMGPRRLLPQIRRPLNSSR